MSLLYVLLLRTKYSVRSTPYYMADWNDEFASDHVPWYASWLQSLFLTQYTVNGVYLLYSICTESEDIVRRIMYVSCNKYRTLPPYKPATRVGRKKERDHPCPTANQQRCLTQTGQVGYRNGFRALPGGSGIFNRRTWGDTRCDNTSSRHQYSLIVEYQVSGIRISEYQNIRLYEGLSLLYFVTS